MLMKRKAKLKCSFDKSWGVQIKHKKQLKKSLGKTGARKLELVSQRNRYIRDEDCSKYISLQKYTSSKQECH